ncbi:MAG: hypothetical protein O3C40_08230 [Planctomycetota bacterium]|nr:hypothetical protein [Planctomycetota bacterium]
MHKLTQLSAETQLNWAFADFDMGPVPKLIIHRCDLALEKRPDWQEAHYLRALGHFMDAKLRLQSEVDERDENKLAKSISDARFDFERAISIGPPRCRLFADAAEAYMIPSANPPTERLQQLLKSAVRHGMLQPQLKTFGEQHDWLEEPWFQELNTLCASNSNIVSEPTYGEMFLTAPNADLVDARLEAYCIEFKMVPFPARLATER